jgi:hypothetical protein
MSAAPCCLATVPGFFISEPEVQISLEAERIWIHVLRQLVTMQVQVTRDKVHAVGRGTQ